jgi:hypothetical protein
LISKRKISAVVVATVSLALASAAAAENYRYKIVAADRAAAKLAVLGRADINPFTGWKGGPRNADRSEDAVCPRFHPRRSDLVITGDAASQFVHQAGAIVFTTAQVFRTREMMETGWRRELLAPGAEACVRASIAASFRGTGRILSFQRLAFPQRGSHTIAYRVTIRLNNGREILADTIFFANGRTVCTLLQMLPNTPQTPAALLGADTRIVSALANRIVA